MRLITSYLTFRETNGHLCHPKVRLMRGGQTGTSFKYATVSLSGMTETLTQINDKQLKRH